MTSVKADKDLLIETASFSVSPVALLYFKFSDPAKSIRLKDPINYFIFELLLLLEIFFLFV